MWPNPEQTVVFQFLIFFFQAQVYFCVRPLRAFFVHFPVFWAHLAIFVICVSIRECRFELFLYFLLRGEYRVEPDAGHPSPVDHRGEHDLLKIEMSLHGVHIKGPETGVAHTQKFLFCLPANFFGKTYRPSSFPHVFSLKIIQKLSPALKNTKQLSPVLFFIRPLIQTPAYIRTDQKSQSPVLHIFYLRPSSFSPMF